MLKEVFSYTAKLSKFADTYFVDDSAEAYNDALDKVYKFFDIDITILVNDHEFSFDLYGIEFEFDSIYDNSEVRLDFRIQSNITEEEYKNDKRYESAVEILIVQSLVKVIDDMNEQFKKYKITQSIPKQEDVYFYDGSFYLKLVGTYIKEITYITAEFSNEIDEKQIDDIIEDIQYSF